MHATNFDIFAASETWLNRAVPRSHTVIDGYQLIRNDRSHKRGGGVCMYIKIKLNENKFKKNGGVGD